MKEAIEGSREKFKVVDFRLYERLRRKGERTKWKRPSRKTTIPSVKKIKTKVEETLPGEEDNVRSNTLKQENREEEGARKKRAKKKEKRRGGAI